MFSHADPVVLVCGVLLLCYLTWLITYVIISRRLLDMMEAVNNAVERVAVELRKKPR